MRYIAWVSFPTINNNAGFEIFFVSNLPGEPDAFGPAPNGDYGYDKKSKAKLLNERQARRFIKDKEYCGSKPNTFGITRAT